MINGDAGYLISPTLFLPHKQISKGRHIIVKDIQQFQQRLLLVTKGSLAFASVSSSKLNRIPVCRPYCTLTHTCVMLKTPPRRLSAVWCMWPTLSSILVLPYKPIPQKYRACYCPGTCTLRLPWGGRTIAPRSHASLPWLCKTEQLPQVGLNSPSACE